jgi:arabinose-5-phosphate isomerase
LELRNFTSDDFARYHPGGALGKQLYLKVEDLIAGNELPKVALETSIKDVILEISSKRLGATAVVTDKDHLLGIITDGDLRRMLQKQSDLSKITAADIMSGNPKTIERSELAVAALAKMQENSISQLVAMDGQRVVGFVHLHDLLREGIV